MDFRNSKVIVLDSSSDFVRVIYGLDELLKPPSSEVLARVGKRLQPDPATSQDEYDQASTSTTPAPGSKPPAVVYLIGSDLEKAEAAGEELEIIWPFRDGWTDWKSIEALWKYALYQSGPYHRRTNESPIIVTHPSLFSNNQIHLLTQVLFERLNVPAISLLPRPVGALFAGNATTGVVVDIGLEETSITPVVDSTVCPNGCLETSLGVRHCELWMASLLTKEEQLIKTLQSPSPSSLEEPESSPKEQPASPSDTTAPSTTAPGESEASKEINAAPTTPPTPPLPPVSDEDLHDTLIRLSEHMWKNNLIRPVLAGGEPYSAEQEEEGVTDIAAALVAGREKALIEARAAKSHKSAAKKEEEAKKRAAQAAAAAQATGDQRDADVTMVEFEGRELWIGHVRQRFCEPLFEPSLLQGIKGLEGLNGGRPDELVGVQELVQMGIACVNGPEKVLCWEGVSVVGEMARVKTFPVTLLSHLMQYILTDPESISEVQPKNTRFLRIPKYFPEYVEEGGWSAPFLGASIVGKLVYADLTGKYFTTKVDYNRHGPARMTSAPDL
ncbi:Actin and related proteins [Phaffia rhodozyma]|uniref:Actin and related proteins n=1 Tax=Phaffia rhodozyma TaxID=264483 RepID=A0A0F7SJK9_PHARH|nr:Actin and related proteins [Phaffia rhodozyma]